MKIQLKTKRKTAVLFVVVLIAAICVNIGVHLVIIQKKADIIQMRYEEKTGEQVAYMGLDSTIKGIAEELIQACKSGDGQNINKGYIGYLLDKESDKEFFITLVWKNKIYTNSPYFKNLDDFYYGQQIYRYEHDSDIHASIVTKHPHEWSMKLVFDKELESDSGKEEQYELKYKNGIITSLQAKINCNGYEKAGKNVYASDETIHKISELVNNYVDENGIFLHLEMNRECDFHKCSVINKEAFKYLDEEMYKLSGQIYDLYIQAVIVSAVLMVVMILGLVILSHMEFKEADITGLKFKVPYEITLILSFVFWGAIITTFINLVVFLLEPSISVENIYVLFAGIIITAILLPFNEYLSRKNILRAKRDGFANSIKIHKLIKAFFQRLEEKIHNITGYGKLNKYEKIVAVNTTVVWILAVITVAFDMSCLCLIYMWTGNVGAVVTTGIILVLISIYILITAFKNHGKVKKLSGNYIKAVEKAKEIQNGIQNEQWFFEEDVCDKDLEWIKELAHEFKKLMDDRIEAEKMKVELLANVSHDLKTPLTSIISYADLLKDEEMSSVAKDYVEIIIRKSDRLKNLVSDVFELTKANCLMEIPLEQLDGVLLVRQVLADMEDRFSEKNKIVVTTYESESCMIYADSQKLYRVVQNIFDNAVKYSAEGTRIFVKLGKRETKFFLEVKNVGNYIMDFDVNEIFERFTRADKARNTEGSGLGLAIAKSFTELMKGKLQADVDGDVFKITLTI